MAKKIAGYIAVETPAPPTCRRRSARRRSARPQHHGILQGLQCEDPADGKGDADPRHHHRLSGPPFTFEMKQPPVSFFLKKAANLKLGKKPASGSKTPAARSSAR